MEDEGAGFPNILELLLELQKALGEIAESVPTQLKNGMVELRALES